MDYEDILDKAYKKLKSSVYYDKTNLILRDKIVNFESYHGQDLKGYLYDLWETFMAGNDVWEEKKQEILRQVNVKLLPKKVRRQSRQSTEAATSKVITNFVAEHTIDVEEIQYFIDMPIEAHILGVLWFFLVGWKLDKELQNCYGNRIRKKLYKDSSLASTYSPYLFEPYFENYESWRDTALEKAQEYLKQGDDVLIISLDFKRFFYSVDMTEKFMETLLKHCEKDYLKEDKANARRINEFVMDVIRAYHVKISQYDQSFGNVLPIGFIPSNILANCCLQNFDDAITTGWAPLYYGRYVDDILIVDRVEKSSPIFQEAHDGTLTIDRTISYYLVQENRWPHNNFAEKCGNAVLQKCAEGVYCVLPEYTQPLGPKTKFLIQDEKAKVFYFDNKNTDAMISCFREKISKSKSEFRRMPEDDGKPNRDYTRYRKISRLVNEAITQKADFLVMPEACTPYEWLPTLARTCARTQMAVVTGVEHMLQNGCVYNMTAIILPFEMDEYCCAQIFFHHKNHFAPAEKRLIQGYRLQPVEGSGYELYRWNDFYFSVYCCYELASIHDRAIFQSYVDAIVAVEWNHDVNHYSNIIESLSRDIHCYCIQVNSSDYGDSRVTIPSKTEKKDILRTKGGEFPAVLAATIDIEHLRNFQLKEFELQKEDKAFKPTPPEFDVKVTEGKIKHTLYENI